MIEFFHKHRSTVLGTFVSVIVAFSMLGFGVGFLGDSEQQAAITIGENDITFDEFYEQRRQIDARYRSMFGPNYYRLAEQLNLNLNQTAIDSLIADRLLTSFTSELGLAAGDELVAQTIQTELFPQGFSKAAYAGYLAQVGKTARQFQEDVRQDIQRRLLRELIEDVAPPTRAEVNQLITRSLTAYDLSYLTVQAEPQTIPEPNAETLQGYFNEHAAEFEEPEKISYRYTVLDLKAFPELVPVSKEEIELFYTHNLGRFVEPPQAKVLRASLDLPGSASEETKKQLREQAAKVVTEINQGEAPEKALSSLEVSTTFEELGWIKEDTKKLKPVVTRRIFSLKPDGERASSVELPGSITLVVVTERMDSRTKELAEVSEEIRKEIVKQAAPAFLFAKGQELYDAWTKDEGTDLTSVVKEHGVDIKQTKEASTAAQDPSPELRGLTQRVMQESSADKLLIDLADKVVLVDVLERKESAIPPLEEIKDKVVERYRAEEAQKEAKKQAQAIMDNKDLLGKGLQEAAKQYSLKEPQKVTNLSQKQPVRNELSGSGAVEKILSGEVAPGILPEIFAGRSSFFIVSLDKVSPPSEEEIKKEFSNYESQAKQDASRDFIAALVNHEKARAAIEVNPSVLGGE